MELLIDKKAFEFKEGETIVQVANRNGINIPTLCYEQKFGHDNSCFVCIVKDIVTGKFLPACSTLANSNMEISTTEDDVIKLRKLALELLLSEHNADCFSPCRTACPAGTDVKDYILYSKKGMELQAFLNIRKTNPFVASVARVCPAFCEKDCSRNNIDETVKIRLIKKYIGDIVYNDFSNELFNVEKGLIYKNLAPKKFGIIGGGPAGLSLAYYLIMRGHQVTIYDENSELGGMLRYAIPSYRLQREILKKEIESIIRLGITVVLNEKITEDRLATLNKVHDHVVLAVGAWKETCLGIGEEQFQNVYPAVEFLKKVWTDKIKKVGANVIIIGGGNSAIDAARTCVRLGAKKVRLIYRRTRKEMPAHSIEIEEAIQKGIELVELCSPKTIKENEITFTVMELSKELDASGRNKIVSTEKQKIFNFDTLIYAVGQKVDFDKTDIKHVCGDANSGASTVIEAIADAKRIATLFSEKKDDELSFYSCRQKGLLPSLDYQKLPPQKVEILDSKLRISNFKEIEKSYSQPVLYTETERCISCGCTAISDCELRKLSKDYQADASKFKTKNNNSKSFFEDKSTGFIMHDNSKCIKCGKCIKVCNEVVGAKTLSFMERGLSTYVSANTKNELRYSNCILCGMCIDHCPTGSFTELQNSYNWENIEEEETVCKGCVLACKLKTGFSDGKIVRVRSFDTPICSIGRWGWVDNYKNIETYYTGLIRAPLVELKSEQIVNIDELYNFDCIVSLDYDPQANNPRVFYEFQRLRSLGKKVELCSILKAEKLLETYKNNLLVFNYLDQPKDLSSVISKAYKLLPVHKKPLL